MPNDEINTDKLLADMQVVMRDAEELVRATADEVTGRAKEARENLIQALDRAKSTCNELQETAVERAEELEDLVRQKPLQALGLAAGIGLLAGMILNRK